LCEVVAAQVAVAPAGHLDQKVPDAFPLEILTAACRSPTELRDPHGLVAVAGVVGRNLVQNVFLVEPRGVIAMGGVDIVLVA
jgi:hypothetical protein